MIKKIFIGIINIYRKYISGLKKPCCRFYPTCSKYALDAVNKYGVIKGGFMAFWRVLRCNPFNPGGYDPVK